MSGEPRDFRTARGEAGGEPRRASPTGTGHAWGAGGREGEGLVVDCVDCGYVLDRGKPTPLCPAWKSGRHRWSEAEVRPPGDRVPDAAPAPEDACPECKGRCFSRHEHHAQICGTIESEEERANFCHANCSIEDVPCRVCKGSGRLVGVPRAVYMARGGAAPIQRRGYA